MQSFLETYGKALFVIMVAAVLSVVSVPLAKQLVGSTDYKMEVKSPGLYDAGGDLIIGWKDLIEQYDLDVTKDYTSTNYKTSETSLYSILKEDELSGGTYLFVDNDVTKIGRYAFAGCSGLKGIHLTENVTLIGSYAFTNCSTLESFVLPNKVTSLEQGTFENCSSLTTFGMSVGKQLKTINNDVFKNCTSLKTISIPESVKTIGDYAFAYCTNLEEVKFKAGSLVSHLGEYAFTDCTSLKTISLPGKLRTLNNHVFENCSSLRTVSLPGFLTDIGNYTFANCSSLIELDIPDTVKEIGSYAFAFCDGLKTVELSEGIEKVGDHAFYNASQVSNILLSKNVESVGTDAFGKVQVLCYSGHLFDKPWGALSLHKDTNNDGYCDICKYHEHMDIILNHSLDINNMGVLWTKNTGGNACIQVANTGPMNILTSKGSTSYWEYIYHPINVEVGKEYILSFDYEVPSAYETPSTFDGIACQIVKSVSTEDDLRDKSVAMKYIQKDKTYDGVETMNIRFTAQQSTYYVLFNFGMATDNKEVKLNVGNFSLFQLESMKLKDSYNFIPSITQKGYTLEGWYNSDGTKVSNGMKPAEQADHVLTAKYAKNKYNQVNNFYCMSPSTGSWVKYKTVTTLAEYGSYHKCQTALNKIQTPKGYYWYVFNSDGWYVLGDNNTSSGNGHYKPTEYTITYDIGEGKKGPTNQKFYMNGIFDGYDSDGKEKYYNGSKYSTEIPVRDGYEFLGWKHDGSDELYQPGSIIDEGLGNHTIYAQWKENGYDIAYVLNNASTNYPDSDLEYRSTSKTLPKGYTYLDYIESTGTQYINTGYKPTSENLKVEISFNQTNGDSYQSLFGTEDNKSSSKRQWSIVSHGKSNSFGHYVGNSSGIVSTSASAGTKHTYIMQANNGTLTVDLDGNKTTGSYSGVLCKKYNMLIFANNIDGSAGQFAKMKLYGFKITDNGSLVRDMVPCRSENGEIGLYDLIEKQFYGNSGTGGFTIGMGSSLKELPEDYTQLEYIEGTGTQYINTGFSAPNGFIMEGDVEWTSGMTNYVVGSHNETSSSGSYGRNGIGGSWQLGLGDTYPNSESGTCAVNVKYHLNGSTVKGDGYLIVDGKELLSSTDATPRSSNNVLIFQQQYGIANNQAPATLKIYYLNIYDNTGTLVRSLIPAKNKSGTIGMYDLVGDKFYINSGTGTFVGGKQVVYKQLDYIESTGTQYIDTEIRVNKTDNYTFVIDAHFTNSGWAGANGFLQFNSGDNGIKGSRKEIKVVYDGSTYKEKIYVDGTLKTTSNWESLSGESFTNLPIGIFHLGSGQGAWMSTEKQIGKVYSMKVWNGDALVRDMIPAMNTNGDIGMVDRLTGKFYGNEGTGKLLAGAYVSDNPTGYKASTPTFKINNPIKKDYKLESWTEEIYTTSWTKGFINLSSGAIENSNSSYPNAVYSEKIYLEKGIAYTIKGTNLGGIRWRAFDANGNYLGNKSDTNTYTPTENMYVRILLYEGCTEANRNSMKIVSTKGSDLSVAKGSTGNRIYTANWTVVKKDTYTIQYIGNGATSGSTASSTHTQDEAKLLTKNGFERKYVVTYNHNYNGSTNTSNTATATFNGWAKTSDGVKMYNDQESVLNLTNISNATVNLYANWTLGSVKLASPTRTGYVFNGWYDAATGGNKVGDAGATYTPTSDKMLYARWSTTNYTVTYNSNLGLPSGYKVLSYIESTGTQYIDTGVKPTNTTGYEIKHSICADNSTDNIIIGAREDSGNTRFWTDIDWGPSKTIGWGYTLYSVDANRYPITNKAGTVVTTSLNYNNDRYGRVDGVVYDNSIGSKTLSNLTKNIYIFAGNYSGTASYFTSAKVYSVKITEGTTLVRNFIPCISPSGEIGMYDTVGAKFYGNSGTGTFKASETYVTSYNVETETFSLPNPTNSDYTFVGWYDNASFTGSKVTSIAKGSTGNRTVYAKWSATNYTINYNLNGGSLPSGKTNPTSYNIETSTFTLNNPEKAGYTFAGWTGSNGTTKQTSVSVVKGSTGNKTFTANWTPTNYTITYDLDGGSLPSGKTNPTSYNIETSTFTLNNPERNGYTFAGWTGSNGSTKQTSVSVTKGSTGNKTFTANWTVVNYTISYNLDGGSLPSGKTNPTSYNIETATITLNNPTKSGFTFVGWTGSNGSTKQTTVSITKGSTGNKSFTANWTAAIYKVTLNNQSATTAGTEAYYYQYKTTTIVGGETIYYYTDENCQTPLYSYTITKPTKRGYIFGGYWTKKNGAGTQYVNASGQCINNLYSSVADNSTLYAKWTPEVYTISYNANGGSGTMDSHTVNYDAKVKIKDNTFTRTGYTFKGYAVTADGTANQHGWSSGATGWEGTWTYVNGQYGIANNKLTLYAIWEVNSYTIAYVLNSGTAGSKAPTTANYNATFEVSNPTRTGYTFNGWNITGMDSCTHTYGSSTSTATSLANVTATSFKNLRQISGTVTFSAQWTPIAYTISYNSNGGSGTMDSHTVNFGTSFKIKDNTFTKPGYSFVGWTTNSNGTNDNYGWFNASTYAGYSGTWNWTNGQYGIANNKLVLYAMWKGNNYTLTLNNNGGNGGTTSVTATTGAALPNITKPSKSANTFGGYYEQTESVSYALTDYRSQGINVFRLETKDKSTLWTMTNEDVGMNIQAVIDILDTNLTTQPTIEFNDTAMTVGTDVTITKAKDGWRYVVDFTIPSNAKMLTLYRFIDFENISSTASISVKSINVSKNKYYNADGTGAKVGDLSSDKTVYAVWNANPAVKVTYNTNGGGGGVSSSSSPFKSSLMTLSQSQLPRKAGHEFGGYYLKTTEGKPTSIANYPSNNFARVELGQTTANGWTLTDGDIGKNVQAVIRVMDSSLTSAPTIDFNDKSLTAGSAYTVEQVSGGWLYRFNFDIESSMPYLNNGTKYRFIDFNGTITANTKITVQSFSVNEGKYYNIDGTPITTRDRLKDFTIYAVWNKLLPSEYIPLDYIEATGTQYIKTGVIGTAKWEFDMQYTDTTTRQLMGYGGSAAEYWGSQTDGKYGLFAGSTIETSGDRDYIIHNYGEGGTYTLTIDGTSMSVAQTDVTNKEYQIFAINGGYLTKAKLYGAKTIQNGVLIRNFAPVMNQYGEVGLYDTVNGKFYSNVGTGSFAPGLPSGYTPLTYIESTGTQFIDTGLKTNQNTRVVAKASYTSNYSIYGAKSGVTNFTAHSGVGYFYYDGGQGASKQTDLSNAVHVFEQNKNLCYVDGTLYHTFNTSSFTSSCNLFLFARNNGSGGMTDAGGNVRIYNFMVYDNGTLVRNMIPCKNSSGTLGLYDTVNSKFYSNAGSGTFNAGLTYKNQLPSGYTAVSSVQTDGTDFINTGVIWDSNDLRMQGDYSYNALMGHSSIMGTQGNGGNLILREQSGALTLYASGTNKTIGTVTTGNRIEFDFETKSNKTGTYYVQIANGKPTTGSISHSNQVNNTKIYLFDTYHTDNNQPGSVSASTITCKAKLSNFKIWKNGVLFRNFTPCKNAYGEYGLYDVAYDKFYGFSAALPNGYTELEHIEFNGSQYIDTGVPAKSSLKSQIKMMANENIGGVIYGTITSGTGDTNDYRFFNAGGYCYLDFPNNSRLSGGSIATGTIYNLEIGNYYVKNLATDTNIVSGSAVSFSELNTTLKLFRDELGNGFGKGRVYHLKIWDNGTLIRDFRPCKNSAGDPGLYDTVNRRFYPLYCYNITLNANGGSLPSGVASSFVHNGSSYTPPSNPTRSGYAFAGWNTMADGSGTTYLPGNSITLTKDITLYAKWIQTVTISYTKTADLNWAAATIYPNLTSETGPVSGSPNYLHCAVSPPTGTSVASSSLNFGAKFTSESGRDTQSLSIPLLGTYSWQYPGKNVGAASPTYTLTVPVGTKLTFTVNNKENHGQVGAIYAGNSTSSTRLWGPGESKNIGTYTYTVNSNVNIRANWKTSGEYVPGLTEVIKYIGVGSSTDDRNSWWDVHIY